MTTSVICAKPNSTLPLFTTKMEPNKSDAKGNTVKAKSTKDAVTSGKKLKWTKCRFCNKFVPWASLRPHFVKWHQIDPTLIRRKKD